MRKSIIFLSVWCVVLTIICGVMANEIYTLKRYDKNNLESIIQLQELALKSLEIYKNQLLEDKTILKIPDYGWSDQWDLTEPNCGKDCLENFDSGGSHFDRNNIVR